MKTTGHNAKTVSKPNTGLRALLRGPLRGKGSGARSVLLLVPVLVVAILAFATAPALAAAPETPTGEEAVEITADSAKLKGVVNPNKPGEPGRYRFRMTVDSSSCKAGEGSEYFQGATVGHSPEPVESEVTNLLAGDTYTFCLEAENEVGELAEGATVMFKTPAKIPTVTAEASEVTNASTANVSAEINPDGLSTSYRVEYVSEAQFQAHGWSKAVSAPNPEGELAASSTDVRVRETLNELQPQTVYRYRYVATSSLGSVSGEEATFTTASVAASGASSSELPDGRVYELVSTSGSYGEPYEPTSPEYGLGVYKSEYPVQAAIDGEALAYVGETAGAGGSGNQGNGEGNEWLAKRGLHSWEDEVISPRGTDSGEEVLSVFQAFSPDLSSAIFITRAQPPLTSDAPAKCQDLYSRASATGAYTSLFTETSSPGNCGDPDFAGSSEDRSQVIFESEAALTENAEEATEIPTGHYTHSGGYGATTEEPCMFGCNLYEAVGGKLRLVNVLPGSEAKTVPNATFGGYAGDNAEKTDFSNAISADGSRIFWTDTRKAPTWNMSMCSRTVQGRCRSLVPIRQSIGHPPATAAMPSTPKTASCGDSTQTTKNASNSLAPVSKAKAQALRVSSE